MNTSKLPNWKRGIVRRGREIKGLSGGVHRYAAPFRRIAEWTAYGCLKGRGPRMVRVTSKSADFNLKTKEPNIVISG
jgi:hypothetical protein